MTYYATGSLNQLLFNGRIQKATMSVPFAEIGITFNAGPSINLNQQSQHIAAPQCDYSQRAGIPDPDLFSIFRLFFRQPFLKGVG